MCTRFSASGSPPPVGTSQTNLACSPGSTPGGILWIFRCAISTSWSQVIFLSGAPFRLTSPFRYSRSSAAHSKLCAAIETSVSFILLAAPAAAPPSMIAMRLPTGLLEGSACSESARTTRTAAGSRSSTSPITVDTSDSWPWPELEVLITPVTLPARSTRTRHESIQVVVSFFGLSSTSNAELPPEGSRQVETPMPASFPFLRAASRFATSSG